jgi:hypothetical protein
VQLLAVPRPITRAGADPAPTASPSAPTHATTAPRPPVIATMLGPESEVGSRR